MKSLISIHTKFAVRFFGHFMPVLLTALAALAITSCKRHRLYYAEVIDEGDAPSSVILHMDRHCPKIGKSVYDALTETGLLKEKHFTQVPCCPSCMSGEDIRHVRSIPDRLAAKVAGHPCTIEQLCTAEEAEYYDYAPIHGHPRLKLILDIPYKGIYWVDVTHLNKVGWDLYACRFPDATVLMTAPDRKFYDIPIAKAHEALQQGLKVHTVYRYSIWRKSPDF